MGVDEIMLVAPSIRYRIKLDISCSTFSHLSVLNKHVHYMDTKFRSAHLLVGNICLFILDIKNVVFHFFSMLLCFDSTFSFYLSCSWLMFYPGMSLLFECCFCIVV